jgi:YNFM family putative membrane transporter
MTRERASTAPRPAFLERGSPAYRRANLALFLAGFATFSLLYCVQPLLPEFADAFKVSAAASALPLSAATAALALSIAASAVLSESSGRRGLMFAAMAGSALLNLAAAGASRWFWLVALRAAGGLALGGAPAVAMTYLAEEVQPRALGFAMGLYVAGTAFGGMCGRVAGGALADLIGWRGALAVIGAVDFTVACAFLALLPKSKNFARRPGLGWRDHLAAWNSHLRRPALVLLFAIGFLLMGAFVTVYNYISFRLAAPPFRLSESELGVISTVYLFGIAASWSAGAIAGRFGRGLALPCFVLVGLGGDLLTLPNSFTMNIAGLVVVTIGFFGSHSIASGWIGRLASRAKGHAASLYLLSYYIGSSAAGWMGGLFWSAAGWTAVVAFTAALFASAFLAAIAVRTAEHADPATRRSTAFGRP